MFAEVNMKVQRQAIGFAAVSRQTDRKSTTRNSAFDAILARESGVRRQESVTSVSMTLPREIILWGLMHVV